MKIALLGATGFVGSAIMNEALNKGHSVLAIVRHPEKVPERDHLVAKAGDVYASDSLARLIQGCDAVISAFNPGMEGSKPLRGPSERDSLHNRRHKESGHKEGTVGGRRRRPGSETRNASGRHARTSRSG